MTDKRVENLNILSYTRLITPEELKRRLPISEAAAGSVMQGREVIKRILERTDPRLIIVVGPCSIHDPAAAMEYGQRLKELSERVQDRLYLVMRVYFEKPRSTLGWKGLINDPHMNGSFEIEAGLHIARRLLLDLAELGLPLATEALDPISPQYLQDLISWSAIGARTTESQTHREMSSGLSCAVGFKNGTDGSLAVAVNALKSVRHPHSFLGIDPEGQVSIVRTAGNRYGHIVLRGMSGSTATGARRWWKSGSTAPLRRSWVAMRRSPRSAPRPSWPRPPGTRGCAGPRRSTPATASSGTRATARPCIFRHLRA